MASPSMNPPETINSQDLPEDLRLGQLPTPTPQIVSGDGPGREQVHMLQDNRLVTVERQIASTPERVLELLLQDTFPEEAAVGISSAIFRGARVQRVDVVDLFDLAVIDLAPGSLDPRNTEQRLAFAQFVYTLTSLPGIEAVQFVSTDPANPDDGPIDLAVQTDTGTTLPGARVTRADFELLATPAVALPGFDIPVARTYTNTRSRCAARIPAACVDARCEQSSDQGRTHHRILAGCILALGAWRPARRGTRTGDYLGTPTRRVGPRSDYCPIRRDDHR